MRTVLLSHSATPFLLRSVRNGPLVPNAVGEKVRGERGGNIINSVIRTQSDEAVSIMELADFLIE